MWFSGCYRFVYLCDGTNLKIKVMTKNEKHEGVKEVFEIQVDEIKVFFTIENGTPIILSGERTDGTSIDYDEIYLR